MMNFDYKKQIILTVVIIMIFNLFNTLFKNWIFTSIGFCICGLLWILHPKTATTEKPSSKMLWLIRLAGVTLMVVGVSLRAYLY